MLRCCLGEKSLIIISEMTITSEALHRNRVREDRLNSNSFEVGCSCSQVTGTAGSQAAGRSDSQTSEGRRYVIIAFSFDASLAGGASVSLLLDTFFIHLTCT